MVVVVSSPEGGKRTSVAVAGTQTLKQLVRDACVRLGLADPADSAACDGFSLKHGRRLLDLAASVRLSGLPPGAKLDLVRISSTSRPVSVALQYTGPVASMQAVGRLTAVFPSSATVWSILAHFEQASGGRIALFLDGSGGGNGDGKAGADAGELLVPHVLVMGQEVFGVEDLVRTTLQTLAVTDGTCVLRLAHRPSPISMQEALDAVSQAPAVGGPAASGDSASALALPAAGCGPCPLPAAAAAVPAAPALHDRDRRLVLRAAPALGSVLPAARTAPIRL